MVFAVRRFALYDARAESVLPIGTGGPAGRALDARPSSPPRSIAVRQAGGESGLADTLRSVTAIGISPAALAPLANAVQGDRLGGAAPTRQAVMDEIDGWPKPAYKDKPS